MVWACGHGPWAEILNGDDEKYNPVAIHNPMCRPLPKGTPKDAFPLTIGECSPEQIDQLCRDSLPKLMEKIQAQSNEVEGFAPNTGEGSAKGGPSSGVDLEAVRMAFKTVGSNALLIVLENAIPLCDELATLRESHEALAKALEAARFRLRDIEKYDGIASPSTMAIIDAALTQGGDTK
jgi:hypothetical protein